MMEYLEKGDLHSYLLELESRFVYYMDTYVHVKCA